MGDESAVRVAVRIRPQLAHEKIDLCGTCTSVTAGEPQLVLGKDRAFTYDFVFDTHADQESVYATCGHSLVEGCLDGYNATVLAYGQTGSGKTYSMGTGFDVRVPAEEQGIIPRAVAHLFKAIDRRRNQAEDNNEMPPEFKLSAQFMELYNEEVFDLFDSTREPGKKSNVKIHEDAVGGIYTVGVTVQPVDSQEETMKVLQRGALSRTTASTCMNAQSSRSHAIFTLHIEQRRMTRLINESKDENEQQPETSEFDFETLRAKLHFVDLAGSERLKRTGATGDRAKESISINCGLLALGNVISALGDVTRKASHVPYRDSKLTRLLQDSLGGNSQTLMIACISPTDRDFMETLNTLKYANRARNIKNKVVVNQDKVSQVIMQLRQEIQRLQIEVNEFKQGKRLISEDGTIVMNDLHHENTMLKAESDKLRLRLKAAQETISAQAERLVDLQARAAVFTNNMTKQSSVEEGEGQEGVEQGEESQLESMIKGYLKEIEDLRSQLLQSESLAHQQPLSPFRRVSSERMNMTAIREAVSVASAYSPAGRMFQSDERNPRQESLEDVLVEAKKQMEKDMEKLKQKEFKLARPPQKRKESMTSEDANSTEEEFESAEERESDSDSGSESEDDVQMPIESTESDIAELSSEISIKEKLVFQLEHSKRQLDTMKEQYEHKMITLHERIKRTEAERDHVLGNLSSSEQVAEEVKRKVSLEYQAKLKSLQKEMKQLKAAKKQHQVLLKANAQNEQQLKTLRNDLQEMKKQKVRLMRKLREDAASSKQLDGQRNREIAQLKKQQRHRDHVIKSLEADQKKREVVLKRRNEEIASLRREKNPERRRVSHSQQQHRQPQAHGVVRSAGIPVAARQVKRLRGEENRHARKPSSVYSSVGSRRKWRDIDSKISELVAEKEEISGVENDMDRWIQERHRLRHEIQENRNRVKQEEIKKTDAVILEDLQEQYESLSSNLEYAEARVQDRESDIMALMDAKGDAETSAVTGLINRCSLSEAKYVMERFFNASLDFGVQLAHEKAEKFRLEERLKAAEEKLKHKEEVLLRQSGQWSELHASQSMELVSLMNKLSDEPSSHQDQSSGDCVSDESSHSGSLPPPEPTDSLCVEDTYAYRQQMLLNLRKNKHRRKTATPSELLFSLHMDDSPKADNEIPSPFASLNGHPPIKEQDEDSKPLPDSKLMPPPTSLPPRLQGHVQEEAILTVTQRKRSDSECGKPNLSPPLGRSMSASSAKSNASTGHVFERLAGISELAAGAEGKIVTVKHGEMRRDKCLTCTHLIQGHTSAVLTLTVNGSLLYTGSQDRTVRVWDLEREQEVLCIAGQPSSVTKVIYCPQTHALLTGSQSQIKVWDTRESDFKCVRTLGGHSGSDKVWKGAASSDTVHDMVMDGTGTYLYSATSASSSVKIWDLRKFSPCNKLSGHSAPVTCLLLDEDESGAAGWIFTGSRDHHVRGFDIHHGCPNIQQPPAVTFRPPHYDGVQSLAIAGGTLFSGSRDYSIKQWDVQTHELKQAVNAAHSHWVTAMMKIPHSDVIVSGCRSGMMKLWAAQNCQQLGETSGHKFPINAIAICNGHILTASSDRTVKVWKVRDEVTSS